ncbi:unnamed protein product, partial [Ixodes persulcatus]
HTLETGFESGLIFAFPPLPLTLSSAQLPKRKVGSLPPPAAKAKPTNPRADLAVQTSQSPNTRHQSESRTQQRERMKRPAAVNVACGRRKTAERRFKRRRPRRDVGREDSTGACVFTCDQVDSCQWQFGGLSRGEAGCSLGWTAKRAVSLSAPAPGDRPDTHSKRR